MDRRKFIKDSVLTLGGLSMLSINSFNSATAALKGSDRMPVLFVGHGSPMNAIEDNFYTQEWKRMVQGIPKPSAILCISAHWLTNGTFVTAMEKPRMIYDF